MLPDKIGAIIIQDKKLLLVSDEETPFYWIPGGKIEKDEDHAACLVRELKEELGVDVVNFKFYATKEFFHEKAKEQQMVHYYIVEISGEPKPGKEITKLHWYTAEDYEQKTLKTTTVLLEQVLPMLIGEGLL